MGVDDPLRREIHTAELVIVSRDSDYGVSFEGKNYVNDDLRQEFSDRVSKKRKLLLYEKLSDALKHFARPITSQEQEAESEIVTAASDQHAPAEEQVSQWISVAEALRKPETIERVRLIFESKINEAISKSLGKKN